MSNVFFTADNHFWHRKIIKYCNRPFSSVEEMNDIMIANWNGRVSPYDVIFVVGDFAFGKTSDVDKLLDRLHGKKVLIRGSHDKQSLDAHGWTDVVSDCEFKHGVLPNIFMAHHCHKVWPKSHYGSWHLFGHSHGGLNEYAETEGKILDVGVDSHDFAPWSLDEVKEVMKTRPHNFNHLRHIRRK